MSHSAHHRVHRGFLWTIPAAIGLVLTFNGASPVCSQCPPEDLFFGCSSYPTNGSGHTPWPVVTADVNQDGLLDIVGVTSISNQVGKDSLVVFRARGIAGQPTGGYSRAAFAIPLQNVYTVGNLAVADYSGDGKPDVALIVGVSSSTTSTMVQIYVGDGAGGFAPTSSFQCGSLGYSLAAGDFNHDGRPDLAVLSGEFVSGSAVYSLYAVKNNGAGFDAPNVMLRGRCESQLLVADFNSDGTEDLWVQSSSGRSSFLVLPGNGGGTTLFADSVECPATPNSYSYVASDVTGDGVLDLVFRMPASIGVVTGSIGATGWTPSVGGASLFALPANYGAFAVADVDRDGAKDVVGTATQGGAGGGNTDSVFVLRGVMSSGRPTGAFTKSASKVVPMAGYLLLARDMNGDGAVDLLTSSGVVFNACQSPYAGVPTIASVRDVPRDQGGAVKLSWRASGFDRYPGDRVGNYWIWRSVPEGLATSALAARSAVLCRADLPAVPKGTRVFTRETSAAGDTYWEFVKEHPAAGLSGYSAVVATLADSSAAGNYWMKFMVQARYPSGLVVWSSPADSGQSVDNLPPIAPTGSIGVYSGGTSTIAWQANPEADLLGYHLYRGDTESFVPGPQTLVCTTAAANYQDHLGRYALYKLAAVDVHGNESSYALLRPSGVAEVAEGERAAFSLRQLSSNPCAGSGVRLEVGLASTAPSIVELLDISGRRVALKVVQGAGMHSILLEPESRLVAGIYMLRLTQGGRQISRKVAVAR